MRITLLLAFTVISGSAVAAQVAQPGSYSSTPGYATYQQLSPSMALSGQPSSTPGSTTFGAQPVPRQLGVAPPFGGTVPVGP
jgi:hypothetical protein